MSERDLERKVQALEQEVKKLKTMLRQPVRQHNSQSKSFEIIDRDPDDISKKSALVNGEQRIYNDTKNNKSGIVMRVRGKLVKIEGTIL